MNWNGKELESIVRSKTSELPSGSCACVGARAWGRGSRTRIKAKQTSGFLKHMKDSLVKCIHHSVT